MSIASAPLAALDAALGGALASLLAGGDFEAKPGSASRAARLAGSTVGPRAVALLGLGKAEALVAGPGGQPGTNPYTVGEGLREAYACAGQASGPGGVLLGAEAGKQQDCV